MENTPIWGSKPKNYSEKYAYSEEICMRLKYKRRKLLVRNFDGIRIDKDTIPLGLHSYQTRHSDTDITLPISIVPEGQLVMVNFCGTIVTDEPLDVSEETKITYWSQC